MESSRVCVCVCVCARMCECAYTDFKKNLAAESYSVQRLLHSTVHLYTAKAKNISTLSKYDQRRQKINLHC